MSAGTLTDEPGAAHRDRDVAEDLHSCVAAHLGLEPLEDRLAEAVRRLPRIPPALERHALGELLIGAIDVDELAARAGRSADDVSAALAEFHLDQLLPA